MGAELEPDLCVIGGGPGGYALALQAAAAGLSAVLVERDEFGGRRLRDTLPRHALIAAGRAAAAARAGAGFGLTLAGAQADFARIRQHTAAVISAIAPNYAQARLEAMNVRSIRARGCFTSPAAIEAGGRKIKARRFVIAAGTEPLTPPYPGFDLVRPLDCAGLCALNELPQRLILIGADPEGLALAQALCRLGCEAAVLTTGPLFPSEDEELAAPVRAALARDGVAIEEGVRILRIEPRGESIRIEIAAGRKKKTLNALHFMLNEGRVPALRGLGLDAAGIRYDESGIETSPSLLTSNPRIYAIGSAVKGRHAGGASERDAHAVLRALLGRPGARKQEPATRVIWTSPAIASVGLSESQARAAHGAIRVLRWPYSETERARIEHCGAGHVKLIASPSGALLGAAIVGSGAEELINLAALAISRGMTLGEIASLVVPYPSLTGALRSAASEFKESTLDAPLETIWSSGTRSFEREMLRLRQLARSLKEKARKALRHRK